MIANYHTHTSRCRHATGRDEEYVQAAVDSGLQILGFSDHTPYWFPDGYYSTFRMFPEQLVDYVNSVLELRSRYAGKIQIHLGLETEFYPRFFPELVARLRDTPVEYMILGQHFIGNEVGDHYCGWVSGERDSLHRYCRQVCQAMETGLFTYLAHPGLFHYTGSDREYLEAFGPVVRTAKDCGVPLELNLLGIREGRHYPNPLVWELAAEEGCPVVFGVDAHAPEHFARPDVLQKAKAFAQRYDLTVLDTVPLRSI
jgi:histidinol-phosphatase (PHP family)